MWSYFFPCSTVFVLNSILAVVIFVDLMVNMSSINNLTSCPLFFVTGFESILEGLFGPGLFKDITLFQGKHAQNKQTNIQMFIHTQIYINNKVTFMLKLFFQNKITK